MRFRHSGVRPPIQPLAPAALRPATMSSRTPLRTPTMVAPQCFRRYGPRRGIRISSRPSALTPPVRPGPAPSSAGPHRCTAEVAVCQPVPSSAAVSVIARPRPARRVAHRAARDAMRPGQRNSRVLVGERAHRTRPARAQPAALVPHQPRRAPERRQIRQAHLAGAVTTHRPAAAPTARTTRQLDPDPPAAPLNNAAHRHTRPQPDDQQQRTRKVNNHRDPPESGQQHASDSGGSLPTQPDPQPAHSTRKREEPANTPYGWTVACGSIALSLMGAWWIGSRSTMWFAYGSLPLHWLVWHWLLVPTDPLCI